MAASNEEEEIIFENYLVLKPQEATCFDLVRILYSNDLQARDFFDASIEGRRLLISTFRRRWILFVSVLFQKLLLYLKRPMAAAGSAAELCLNYPPANGGCRRLFFNLLMGRVQRPDKSSEKFTSMVGNLDKRWNLENRLSSRQEDYASLAIMASKLSYENQAFVQNVIEHHWQMEFLGFYNFWNDYQETRSTHAIMFRHKTLIVVALRGTSPFDADDWCTDIDISWLQFPAGVGKIHSGFMKALGLQRSSSIMIHSASCCTGWPKQIPPQSAAGKSFAYYTIRHVLKTLISQIGDDAKFIAKFIVTGHSLGGALAILFAGILTIHEEETLLQRLEGVYTFGQPRVGDAQFGDYMKSKMATYDVKYYRYVYCNDIVPRLPYDDETFLFKHFGPCLYFDSCYNGKILEEEPNKNYFSLPRLVPMGLNAVYEMIRGFVLPWRKGKEYKEGWLMKVFRVTALVTPGLTSHFPVDYVNITRLGKLSPVYPQETNRIPKLE